MNVIKEIERINARELEAGIVGGMPGSWHEKYKDSAWVYIGGLPYELTEGDVICVMSQWGEIEDINLVRDKATNKSLGFAFVKYEDQRSTIIAVDNFNGITLLDRTLRCDHVDQYKLPKEVREREEQLLEDNPEALPDIGPGHAYKAKDLASGYTIDAGIDVWAVPQVKKDMGERREDVGRGDDEEHRKEKKHKKEGKESKEHKHKKEKKEKKEKRSRHDDEQPRYRDKDESGESDDRKQEQYRRHGDNSSSSSSSSHVGDRNSSSSSIARDSIDAGRWGQGASDERSSAPVPTRAMGEPSAASWRGTRDPSFAGTNYGGGGGKESIYGKSGGGGGGGGGDICYAFQKGDCTRGSACKYSHDIGGGGGRGGSSSGSSSSSVGVGSKRPLEGGSSTGGASFRPRQEIGGIGGMNRRR